MFDDFDLFETCEEYYNDIKGEPCYMKNTKEVIYMVTYTDDDKKRHMAFVKGFSSVRFLEERFDRVRFERTERTTNIINY